jgi:hypothetical protein
VRKQTCSWYETSALFSFLILYGILLLSGTCHSWAFIMDMPEIACVHEVLDEGLVCNVCFHLVPQCDPDDPVARTLYATQVRLIWESRAPTLAGPGTSLCERCQSMTLDKLCSAEGYIHSICYWALLASAEVSKCPMCVMMVDVLRGAKDKSFDYSVALENPYYTNR